MSRRSTMRSTVSVAMLATLLAGCSMTSNRVASTSGKQHFGGRSDADLGLATRALAALTSEQFDLAVSLAERAVEKTPRDAGFRSLLGNAYFAAGRFKSAEQAFEDALLIYPNQPKSMLKLALVQIAQGKNGEALRTLEGAQGMIDTSDLGLALALAGRPQEAVGILDQAARADHADAKVRQNLALAYALAGDWQQARIIASQDIGPDLVDQRIEQWMALANPAKPSDQIASLLGVTPAAGDAGQPVRLALARNTDTQTAQAAAPAETPVAIAEAARLPEPIAPVTMPEPAMPAYTPSPMALVSNAATASAVAEPLTDDALAALPAVEVAHTPAPAFADTVVPAPPPPNPLRVAAASPAEVPMAMVAAAKAMLPKVRATAGKPGASPAMTKASAPKAAAGKSNAVVQLGAYSTPAAVEVAWDRAAAKFAALRGYSPMSARFDSGKGTFYRLSVRGFENQADAASLCASLKKSGRACFVRTVAGDKPIQLASR